MSQRSRWFVRYGGALLFVAVCLAYAPSFGAGFLNYDDPWLISENPRFARGAWASLGAAWFDLSRQARLSFGAEYLPLRDMLVWLEAQLFQRAPQPMHASSVLLFAASAVLFRRYLLRTWGGSSLGTEIAAWLFALHPLHAESVAWLAGQKDVLALLFIAGALALHAGEDARARWGVPLLVWGACLSKSMSVAVILLLGATDLAKRRRPDLARYAASAALIGVTLALHLYVGRVVHMLAEPLGGSRLHTLYSMGPVWLRYLELCFRADLLSVDHVVAPLDELTVESLTGYAFVLGWLTLGLALALLRRSPLVLFTFVWFFGPLLPVSQVLAPLQNRLADRYLWLSVLAPALLLSFGLQRLAMFCSLPHRVAARQRAVGVVAGGLVLLCAGSTFDRALVFSDSVLLFSAAAQQADSGPRSTYQLGKALEDRGDAAQAIVAYRETLRRAPAGKISEARRATNNLAKLLAARGQLPEAEQVLRAGYARFPDDAKMHKNLIKVLTALGRVEQARRLPPPAPATASQGAPHDS